MSRLLKVVVLSIVTVVVVVVVAIAAYLLTRDAAPEAVDLETAVARIEAAETARGDTGTSSAAELSNDTEDAATTSSAGSDEPTATGTGDTTSNNTANTDAGDTTTSNNTANTDTGDADGESVALDRVVDAAAGLAGVWSVQVAGNAGDLQGEPTVSFAGFRVDEVLSSIGEFTAVGRTADVSGTIELSNTALVAATVEVTMSTLRTDNGSRDNQVRRALGTNDFPLAIFNLAEPVELPAGMADGEVFSGSVQGDLTIKGTTNRVTFDLQAQLVGERIVAVGSSEVAFSDYGVTAPTAPIVVSVEDHGIMEFQLIFIR